MGLDADEGLDWRYDLDADDATGTSSMRFNDDGSVTVYMDLPGGSLAYTLAVGGPDEVY